MIFVLLLPFLLQLCIIGIDEFHFHWKRGLPKWERLGHPLDTCTVLSCFLFVLYCPYSESLLKVYIGLALFSCFFVTKDEFVHKECCPASEQWLHALLFINHPIVLTALGLCWPMYHHCYPFPWMERFAPYSTQLPLFLYVQTAGIALFCLYQIIYWNCVWKENR